ncbi:hypothetical protein DRN67_04335 [Candidatus Micrarchaeota archaeon]|mgnify:CR=1 FL=1|nr:MAG: hypothetical protein DRN67_04335 [Candidatus Micrarchaeota archaeon]
MSIVLSGNGKSNNQRPQHAGCFKPSGRKNPQYMRITPRGWVTFGLLVGGIATAYASCTSDKDNSSATVDQTAANEFRNRPVAEQPRHTDAELTRFTSIVQDRHMLEQEFPELKKLIGKAYEFGLLGENYSTSLVEAFDRYFSITSDNTPQKRQARDQVRNALAREVTWAGVSRGEFEPAGMSFKDAFQGTNTFEPYPTIYVDNKLDENNQPRTQTIDGQQYELREFNIPLRNKTNSTVYITGITVMGENGTEYTNPVNITIPGKGKVDVRLENVPPVLISSQPVDVGEVHTLKISVRPASDIFSLGETQPRTETTQLILLPGNTEGNGKVGHTGNAAPTTLYSIYDTDR